jgi:hypothetical protein
MIGMFPKPKGTPGAIMRLEPVWRGSAWIAVCPLRVHIEVGPSSLQLAEPAAATGAEMMAAAVPAKMAPAMV